MTHSSFTTLAEDRYFEDYVPGAVHACGSVIVSEHELLAFAERYDPQTFHIDRELASHSIYGGLIASGWHTAALNGHEHEGREPAAVPEQHRCETVTRHRPS